MKCASGNKQWWTTTIAAQTDEWLLHKAAVKEPSWDCGDAAWRLWKRLLAQEIHRRGLGT